MCVCVCVSCSVVSDSVTPRSVAHQVPLFMEFSRQEFLSGLPFPFPGDLSNPGIEPRSPTWQADSLPSEPPGKPPNIYQKRSRSFVSDSLRPHGLQLIRLLCPWDFPGKSTGVDCHFLLQGIFLTQELNPGLPHCRQTFYHLSHL